MHFASEIQAQFTNDLRRLLRDRFLLGTFAYIVVVATLLRLFLPYLTKRLADDVDLTAYYPLIASYLALTVAGVTAGVLGGLLLLESREERTLDALKVSPMPVTRLVTYEAAFIYVATVLLIVLLSTIIGVGSPPPLTTVVIGLAGGAFGPVIAVWVAGVASDKVEAFAMLKIVGVVAIAPIAAWWLPEPLQWLSVIIPPYAACKAWWLASAGEAGWGIWVLIGFALNALILVGLIRRWSSGAIR